MPDVAPIGSQMVRRNFVLNILDGAVFTFGLSFASRSTVLPVYVKQIGGEAIALSLIPIVWILGFNLPQIAVANYTRQIVLKKPFLLKTGLAQRFPWLLLAIGTFWGVDYLAPEAALVFFFALFGLAAAGGSINLPVWFDLVANVTPVRLRGRLFAYRTVFGALLGIGAGWAVERILSAGSFPTNFAALFAIAFGVMMCSYVMLCLLREERQIGERTQVRFGEYVRSLPAVMRRARHFRNFLIGEALLVTATMVEAFFAVDAIESFDLTAAHAGRFTIVVMVSMGVGTLAFGYVADRWGHRLNMILAAVCMVFGSIAALLAERVEVYYIAFACAALTLGLRTISRLPIIAELCDEQDRPTYVALANFLTTPFVLTGLAGGWAASHFGYDVVFAAAVALALGAAVWFAVAVREPRQIGAVQISD